MNHFAIFAHGKSLDVDALAEQSTLRPDKVWRRGELRGAGRYQTSGFLIGLGNGAELTYGAQVQTAFEFLRDNQHQLLTLGQFEGVDTFILGVQFNIQLEENTVGFTVDFPARLMEQALKVGVNLVAYVSLIREVCEGDA